MKTQLHTQNELIAEIKRCAGKRYEAKRAEWYRERRVRAATVEIVGFVRALSEDPRTLPWFETARQLIAKLEAK